MNWFAFQTAPCGLVPVAFDEHPKMTPTMTKNLIWSSVRPIPKEMQGAPLSELVVWHADNTY